MELYEAAGDYRRPFSNRPYSWRIIMALAHKDVSVKRIGLPISEKDRLAFSGQMLMPILVDGDLVLPDSWAIAGHLEEKLENAPPLFGGPMSRACARFIHTWGDQRQTEDLVPMLVYDAWRHAHPDDREYLRMTREARLGCTLEETMNGRDEHLRRFRDNLNPLRIILGTQRFICGDYPAYADYIVFSHFQWARSVSPYQLLEPHDPVFDWRERMFNLFDGLARNEPGYDV